MIALKNMLDLRGNYASTLKKFLHTYKDVVFREATVEIYGNYNENRIVLSDQYFEAAKLFEGICEGAGDEKSIVLECSEAYNFPGSPHNPSILDFTFFNIPISLIDYCTIESKVSGVYEITFNLEFGNVSYDIVLYV